MKYIFLSLLLGGFCIIGNSQITKRNWMLGGNAKISFVNQTINSASAKGQYISLSPNAGYFFIDKLSGGIRIKYGFDKVTSGPIVAKTTTFNIGPFVRYYLLQTEKRVNCFTDATFQFGKTNGSNSPTESSSNIILSAGSVFFLNTSVGFECAVNYDIYNRKSDNAKAKTLFFTFGFQIHLEKEKD